jgi:L-threonate 2-dehydrogenase
MSTVDPATKRARPVTTIGILGTGDMGSAVGARLHVAGRRVVTALEGRSPESAALAGAAGFEDLGSLAAVLDEAELLLSILPPAAAPAFAVDAAAILRANRREIVFADCNAVAPATVRHMARLFDDTRAHFIDVGIVGPAPKPAAASPTRFYVAGPGRKAMLDLAVPEFAVIDMGEAIGRAAAIKICYAAMNKGVDALYATILLAASRLDVAGELRAEFAASQTEALARMERRIPFLAATAGRYTGEMAEIAAGFDAVGVTGDFHRGAEWLYSVLARSDLASETRASLPAERSLDEALKAFVAALEQ